MNIFNFKTNNKSLDYKTFSRQCVEELKLIQDNFFKKYDINSYENWYYDQPTGLFSFSTGDEQLNFQYFEIGTFSIKSNTWMWSWYNESTLEKVKSECNKIREFGAKSNYDKLTTGYFKSDEVEAWELAAIALKVAGGLGIYRPISHDVLVFTILKEVVSNQKAQAVKDKYIDCEVHGSERLAFVCQHLLLKEKVGFEEAFETSENMELEDDDDFQAWCYECEKVRQQEGEWNEASMAFADIRLICEKCYFNLKKKCLIK